MPEQVLCEKCGLDVDDCECVCTHCGELVRDHAEIGRRERAADADEGWEPLTNITPPPGPDEVSLPALGPFPWVSSGGLRLPRAVDAKVSSLAEPDPASSVGELTGPRAWLQSVLTGA